MVTTAFVPAQTVSPRTAKLVVTGGFNKTLAELSSGVLTQPSPIGVAVNVITFGPETKLPEGMVNTVFPTPVPTIGKPTGLPPRKAW